MSKTRAGVSWGVILSAVACVAAADKPLQRFGFAEGHMGTKFKIIVYAKDEAAAAAAARAAFARVAELDGIMSDYRDTSELMRLCQKAGGPPVEVSDDLFRVLSRAEAVSRLSHGAFDVTVGPVVKLWRRVRYTKRMPPPEELEHARSLVGYQNVRLDPDKRTVQLLKPGMRLDLGGIAKGYAADAALAVLRKHGITRALVAAGGDIAVSDPPPGAEGWKVGIAPLLDPDSNPTRFLVLKNAAVSTSGDAEQFIEIGGKRYSHIVDPRTGVGLVCRVSVTVVASDGTTADSLTKVVAILGPEKGLPIIDAVPGAAALVVRASERWKFLKTHHRVTEGTEE
jgi:thiamine biosynthesis lipoprotein